MHSLRRQSSGAFIPKARAKFHRPPHCNPGLRLHSIASERRHARAGNVHFLIFAVKIEIQFAIGVRFLG